MKLQLVIQETTAGLNNQFVSEGFDINSDGIKSSLKDERMLAAQIANQSTVYSVQILDKYKVYSAIYTDITDFTGRSGYFSIKIYTQRDTIIRNLINLHEEIKNAYLQFKLNNQINSQNYDSILLNANILGQKIIVCPKAEKTCFSQYSNLQEVEATLNNLKVYSIDKLYLFNIEKALKTETITGQGLLNFNSLVENLEYFEVNNSYKILKSLFIGDKQFTSTNFPETFGSFRKRNDSVSFLTNDNNEKQIGHIQNQELKINKRVIQPYTPPQRPKPQNIHGGAYTPERGKKSFFEKNQIYILSLLLLIVGGMCYYVFFYDSSDSLQNERYSKNNALSDDPQNNEETDTTAYKFTFLENSNPDVISVKSNYNDLLNHTAFGFFKSKKDSICFIVNLDKDTTYIKTRELNNNDFKDLNIVNDSINIFLKELKAKCGCNFKLDNISEQRPQNTSPSNTRRKSNPINNVHSQGNSKPAQKGNELD